VEFTNNPYSDIPTETDAKKKMGMEEDKIAKCTEDFRKDFK
jgi:hypothetical protein